MLQATSGDMSNKLQNVLNTITIFLTEKLPTILVALAVLIIGWIIAKVIAGLVRKALNRTGLSATVGGSLNNSAATVEKWAGKIVYYIIMLFVLVAFFQRLGLEMVSAPLNNFLSSISGYSSRILGAAFLIVAAWALATAARMLVRKVLDATSLDERLGEYLAEPGEAGTTSLAGTLSTFVYWLVWLLFLNSILDALGLNGVLEPIKAMTQQILSALPKILVAIAILVVSWYAAGIVRRLLVNLLGRVGFNSLPQRMGLNLQSTELGSTPAEMAGHLATIIIMLFATMQAAEAVGFTSLSGVVHEIVGYAGNIVRAIIILGLGFYLANLLSQLVQASGNANANLLSKVARFGIIALSVSMALRQALPNDDIVDKAFTLLLGAVAVAIALAFGLGGREAAGRMVEDWRNSLKRDN